MGGGKKKFWLNKQRFQTVSKKCNFTFKLTDCYTVLCSLCFINVQIMMEVFFCPFFSMVKITLTKHWVHQITTTADQHQNIFSCFFFLHVSSLPLITYEKIYYNNLKNRVHPILINDQLKYSWKICQKKRKKELKAFQYNAHINCTNSNPI